MLVLNVIMTIDVAMIMPIVGSNLSIGRKAILALIIAVGYIFFWIHQCFGDSLVKRIVGRLFFYTCNAAVIILTAVFSLWYVVPVAILSILFKFFCDIFSSPKV